MTIVGLLVLVVVVCLSLWIIQQFVADPKAKQLLSVGVVVVVLLYLLLGVFPGNARLFNG